MASLASLRCPEDALQNHFAVVCIYIYIYICIMYMYIQAFELGSIYTPYPDFDGQKKSAYEGLTNPNWFMGPPVSFD